ncbi:hypothetical protein N9092_03690 [Akkermansiaceae bacterium]|nr:hypothetical protein [Akkermansiaceae bacterium]
MSKILLLSNQNRYLEHDLYCRLGCENKSRFHELIYVDAELEKILPSTTSKVLDIEEKAVVFDSIEKIDPPILENQSIRGVLGKIFRRFRNILKLYSWKLKFLSKINSLKPDAIIVVSALSVTTRLVLKCYGKAPVFYIQPAVVRYRPQSSIGYMNSFVSALVPKSIFFPRSSKRTTFFEGSEFKRLYSLMWSKTWFEDVGPNARPRFYEVGFPTVEDGILKNHCHSIPIKRVLIVLNKRNKMSGKSWMKYWHFYNDLINVFPNLHFQFKKHPIDPLGDLKITKLEFIEEVEWEYVDLVICHWSTILRESVAFGIPTILVNPEGKFDRRLEECYLLSYPYIAKNISDVKDYIEEFQLEPKRWKNFRRDFIKKDFSKYASESSKRIFDIIKEKVSESGNLVSSKGILFDDCRELKDSRS